MKDILLVTTSERVKVVFQSMERRGGVTVRVATSLSLAKLAVTLGTPDCTFVEVSADSLDIQVEEIPALLPDDANLALLTDGSVDITWARKRSLPVIDLGLEDAAIRSVISEVVDRAGASMAPLEEPEAVQEDPFGRTIEVGPEPIEQSAPRQAAAAPEAERFSGSCEVDWSRYPTVRELLQQEQAPRADQPSGRRGWNWVAIMITAFALAAMGFAGYFQARAILRIVPGAATLLEKKVQGPIGVNGHAGVGTCGRG